MFKTLRNAFKVKDIRDRILFTFLMLIIIRIGSELPAPGVDGEVFKQWWASQSADGLGFFNAITGGSFLNMSVFALNITPYITSSIIIQLLTIAIPKLEEIQRDGEEGRKKMVALTRYVTIVLALIQSIAMTIGFYRGGYLTGQGPLAVIEVITGLTAGSAVLMWIGERRKVSEMVFPLYWLLTSFHVCRKIWELFGVSSLRTNPFQRESWQA